MDGTEDGTPNFLKLPTHLSHSPPDDNKQLRAVSCISHIAECQKTNDKSLSGPVGAFKDESSHRTDSTKQALAKEPQPICGGPTKTSPDTLTGARLF